jgi:hypothetical protein
MRDGYQLPNPTDTSSSQFGIKIAKDENARSMPNDKRNM